MKGAGPLSKEGSPSILCFVVFLPCPLVIKPTTAADDKKEMYTSPAPASQSGAHKGIFGDEEE